MTHPPLRGSALALAAALVLAGSPATAQDQTGTMGPLVALRVNTIDADLQLQYHGSLHVDEGGGLQDYFWGGNKCSAFSRSEHEVAMLQRALGEPRVVVRPFYKLVGANRCLVGFWLVRRDKAGLF